MGQGRFRFVDFALDRANRTLTRGGVTVDLNARYLDALLLLVEEAGRLVSKDRFMERVWRGVPVTDEALTQCIRTLRRQLGDDATAPRFIETVPKHGYRFVAPVELVDGGDVPAGSLASRRHATWLDAGAGTLGAGAAGVAGGIVYGSAAASAHAGAGGASVLLVLLWLTIAAAVTGGAGVSLGIAAAPRPVWRIAGGAIGGLVVGGLVKLLGLDAFTLLLGRAPGDIAGALEGLVLGGAVGVGAWLADRPASFARRVALAALSGAAGAVAVALAGGRLMAGSLDTLSRTFPESRLGIGAIGRAFGSDGFGTVAALVTAAMEGALFGGCIVGAMVLARRGRGDPEGSFTLARSP
ncbi:winged helix-turn-helix domain-containing protein [Sphingomonas sp. RS2018]